MFYTVFLHFLLSSAMYMKVKGLLDVNSSVGVPLNYIFCTDGNKCVANSTCCPIGQGQYACCGFEEAVCCPDKLHCCPKGNVCNNIGACISIGSVVIHRTEEPVETELNSVICPGGRSQCPDGTTCCKMQYGEYGCCPFTKAVCCSDELHCCPEHFKCDVTAGSCTRGYDVVNMLAKTKTDG